MSTETDATETTESTTTQPDNSQAVADSIADSVAKQNTGNTDSSTPGFDYVLDKYKAASLALLSRMRQRYPQKWRRKLI